MANMNNNGDRGHPWQVDHPKRNLEPTLFVKTLVVGFVYNI